LLLVAVEVAEVAEAVEVAEAEAVAVVQQQQRPLLHQRRQQARN